MEEPVKLAYKEALLKAVAYHFPAAKVILFGSRARGTHSAGSDIDLAIDIGEPIPLRDMARLRVTLENLPISLEVDVVDMYNIPPEMRHLIAQEGIIWNG